MSRIWCVLLVCLVVGAGCSDGGVDADPVGDPDTGIDADAGPPDGDAADDADPGDTEPDLRADTTPDAAPDAEMDATDAEMDAAEDAMGDADEDAPEDADGDADEDADPDLPQEPVELTFTPASVDFGAVPQGSRAAAIFLLENTGLVDASPLELQVDAPFAVEANCEAILAGETCEVEVFFSPGANGLAEASLTAIVGDEIVATASVQGTGTPTPRLELTVLPTSFQFGDRTAGADDEPEAAVIVATNTGNVSIGEFRVSAGLPLGFELGDEECPETLAPAATCTTRVRFVARIAGDYRMNLTYEGQRAFLLGVPLTGSVVAPDGPASLQLRTGTDIGQARLGASVATSLTVRNVGGEVARLGVATYTGPEFATQTLGTTCREGEELEPGQECVLAVVFTPAEIHRRVETLALPFNDGLELRAEISGTGLGVVLTPSVTNHDFGRIVLGQRSATVSVQYTNDGNLDAVDLDFETDGLLAVAGDCTAQLDVGESCTAQLRFEPESIRFVTRQYAPTEGRQRVGATLSYTGRGVPPSMEIEGDADFGTVAIGATSDPREFVLRNTDEVTAVDLQLRITGDYRIESHTCPDELSPGESCTALVTLTPEEAGVRTGQFAVRSFDSIPANVPLTGTGRPHDVVLSLSPSHHAFRPQVGDTETVVVRVENSGQDPSGPLLVEFEHDGNEPVEVFGDSCSEEVVGPGEACLLTLRMHGTALGRRGGVDIDVSSALGGMASGMYSGFVVP